MRTGGEHAQPWLAAVVYVQGQTRPRAVDPRDVAALHAESVDGCCGNLDGILSVGKKPRSLRAGEVAKDARGACRRFPRPTEAAIGPGRFRGAGRSFLWCRMIVRIWAAARAKDVQLVNCLPSVRPPRVLGMPSVDPLSACCCGDVFGGCEGGKRVVASHE